MTQYAGADAFPVDFTLADDATAPTGAQVNPAFEALADRTVWCKDRISPVKRIIAVADVAIADAGEAFAVVTLNSNPAQWNATAYTDADVGPAAVQLCSFPNLLLNDEIEFEMSGTIMKGGATDPAILKVIGFDATVSAMINVPGAKVVWGDDGSIAARPFFMRGRYVVAGAGPGSVNLALDGRVFNAATAVGLFSAFSFGARVWRSNA